MCRHGRHTTIIHYSLDCVDAITGRGYNPSVFLRPKGAKIQLPLHRGAENAHQSRSSLRFAAVQAHCAAAVRIFAFIFPLFCAENPLTKGFFDYIIVFTKKQNEPFSPSHYNADGKHAPIKAFALFGKTYVRCFLCIALFYFFGGVKP